MKPLSPLDEHWLRAVRVLLRPLLHLPTLDVHLVDLASALGVVNVRGDGVKVTILLAVEPGKENFIF